LWICNLADREKVENAVQKALLNLGSKTKTNNKKTEVSIFTRDENGDLSCDHPTQYLGFIFDGKKIRIRSQTLSKYSRNVVYATRQAKRASSNSSAVPGIVFKRKLYRQLSHLGHRNLITYARRAEGTMETGAIRKQVRGHMVRIAKQLAEPLSPSKAKPPPNGGQ
jgi:RNA-directed DNA polymerase